MKLLKKIRRIANSQRTSSKHSGTNNLPPISFHPIHGDNIRLSMNGTVASRVGSFCKGICFSNRPIRVNERVCIRFLDMSSLWSGLLRFGFTSKDPATFRNSLPKYACPDLTNSGHTYAKALPERYAQKGNVLYFYVTSTGNVHFGINDEDKGVILSNIRVNGPLWALIDCYGNTTKIQSVDSRHNAINHRPITNNPYEAERIYSSVSMIDLPDELAREPSPQIYSQKCLEPLQFHRTRGCNVRLSSNKCTAERNNNYYSQGYVFSQRALCVGEKLMLQLLKTDELYTGSLAFGLTSCDPSTIRLNELPDDSHQLLDRPEYWVVIKDVANSPMAGDEIAFSITETGEVQMTKNRQKPVTLMHVDITQRLWAFFDLYGSTLKVRLLGTQVASSACRRRADTRSSTLSALPLSGVHSKSLHNVHKMNQQQSMYSCPSKRSSAYQTLSSAYKSACSEKRLNLDILDSYQQHYHTDNSGVYQPMETSNNGNNKLQSTSSSNSGSLNSFGNDCLVCYEQPINSVLYMCGHVCMCYDCSIKQWRTSGHCPICRAPIRDVIRTYWS